MPNTKVVFSKELANILVDKNFNLLRTDINLKDVKYKVFIFEYSEALLEEIEAYKKSKGG